MLLRDFVSEDGEPPGVVQGVEEVGEAENVVSFASARCRDVRAVTVWLPSSTLMPSFSIMGRAMRNGVAPGMTSTL